MTGRRVLIYSLNIANRYRCNTFIHVTWSPRYQHWQSPSRENAALNLWKEVLPQGYPLSIHSLASSRCGGQDHVITACQVKTRPDCRKSSTCSTGRVARFSKLGHCPPVDISHSSGFCRVQVQVNAAGEEPCECRHVKQEGTVCAVYGAGTSGN